MGISHFIEHILFKGTKKYPTSQKLSEAVESVGGIINGETDKELSVYWCKVARPHFHVALDVLTDMVLHPNFDPLEIAKERQVIIEEINRGKDSPSQLVDELIDTMLFPGHQLGRDVAGTKKTVGNLSREDMLNYISHQYSPANTVFSIAGSVNHDEMITAVEAATSVWHNRCKAVEYKAYTERPNPRISIHPKKTEQIHLCLALPGISLFDPRRYPLAMLNVILGAGMSSRLFLEVRDRLGLAYSVHSYIDHYQDSGAIVIYAGVDPQKVTTSVAAIIEQLARFKDEPVPETELIKAKELSKGRLWLRMEDSYAVSSWLGGQEILTGKVITDDEMVAIIDSITAQQVQEVAQELFIGDKLRLAIVGKVDKHERLETMLKI